MSHSLPSKEIYVVDVPETKEFTARFEYNFFVPDEQVKETSGIPEELLNKPTLEGSGEYTQFLKTKVPRYVQFSWKNSKIADPGGQLIESDIRKAARKSRTAASLISDNYKKIVFEDQISSLNFVAVTFSDGDIDEKIYNLAQGSYEQLTLEEAKRVGQSHSKAAAQAHSLMPKTIDPHFVSKALSQPKKSHGISKFKSKDGDSFQKKPVRNFFFENLKSVHVSTQINSKFFYDVTDRSSRDPFSPFSLDMHALSKSAKKLKAAVSKNLNLNISESEFKTTLPQIKLRVDRTSHHTQRSVVEIVGYVIDKYEIAADGSLKALKPIILENPDASNAYDFSVKYDQRYCYTIRTIALFNLPAVAYDESYIGTVQVLVSSKPSAKQYIKIADETAPPPPADINFTWDYENDKLLVHWCFPPNSQRDIKKFQLFRRKNIDVPFELLKEYDFDDSAVRAPNREFPDRRAIERVRSPVTFYVDDDFTKDSRYIYTVCSIDAHGLTSNYGAQFELTFDRFKNQLSKKLISHSGAPKPYPNLYLEGEGFVNTANVKGNFSKRMFLYFTPQFYLLEDEHQRAHRVIATKQTGGLYKFQFLNVDNQKSEILTVRIDDRMRIGQKKISFPSFRFDRRRNSTEVVDNLPKCAE
jgi:hypothetical protein